MDALEVEEIGQEWYALVENMSCPRLLLNFANVEFFLFAARKRSQTLTA